MVALTRRGFVAAMSGCAICGSAGAAARVAPSSMQPLVGEAYEPVAKDERGLWQSFEQFEIELASSNLLFDAPDMHSYVVGVMHRLLGERARDTRVYLLRDADFNASMAPNGMMIVHTGLLARVRNEAQLAAVLGHEAGHYLRRHSLTEFRSRQTKRAIIAFVAAGSNVMAGAAYSQGLDGRNWITLANSINNGIVASMFNFSQAQELEADAFGLKLINDAGYAPDAAAQMWRQIIEENRASAAGRGKRYRPRSSTLSTHPPDEMRMLDLTLSAREVEAIIIPGRSYRDGRDEWRAAVAPVRATLIEEQVKLNNPGGSLYLINALAQDGWDGTLRYYEGEAYRLRDDSGDAARAASAYSAAIEFPDAPPEAWRAHGYALIKAGQATDGHAALAHYLDAKPHASDAAMVRFSLAQ